jgi:hypothetical protein
MPLRVTAKRFGMTYSEMRSFILRLVRKKMIGTRTTQLVPTENHPSRKISIINLINYDLYQYVESEQPPIAHLSQQVSIHNTNTHILNTSCLTKSSKEDYDKVLEKKVMYVILLRKDNKKYLKHKFKDEPIKEY